MGSPWKVILASAVAALLALGPAQFASADDIRRDQWYLDFLDAVNAHRESLGEGVVIAIIDSGVDSRHPDISSNILTGTDIVPGGKGNGTADTDGHGTGMASLAAGHGHGTDDGVLGIAPKAKILPIRIHSPSQTGGTNEGARAIEWAIDHGADVICDASGGGITPQLLAAVRRAQQSDIVVVAAAGNRPKDQGVLAPASFPGVIAAAAVDRNGNHYVNSVTGPEVVLAAPGVDIVSASKNGGYRDGSGTSDATAIIAGAAALVRAKYPDLSAEEVIHRLTATATDKGPKGRDEQYGYGVLNLVAALTADVPPLSGQPAGTTASANRSSPAFAQPTPPASGDGAGGTTVLVGVLLLLLLTAGTTGLLIARHRRSRSSGHG